MKAVFKFTFFILLGISALGFVATAFLYVFNPDKAELAKEPEQVLPVSEPANEVSALIEAPDQETKQSASTEMTAALDSEALPEQASVDTEGNTETPSPPDAKQISWDLTPAEQELEVGDWVSIDGYQDDLIGATVGQDGATRVLKWNEPSDLFGTNGMVEIASQSTGLPAPEDKIISVAGLVENPRENETIVRVNKTLLQEQTIRIRVIGHIDRIAGDKTPERWTMFLKKGVYVDFAEQQNWEDDDQ